MPRRATDFPVNHSKDATLAIGTSYDAWHRLKVDIDRLGSIPGTMLIRMDASTTVKRSVALAVVNGENPSKFLLVQRPREDQEFPGMWGLPAASLGPGETLERTARRIGWQKLGTEVRLGAVVACGNQRRSQYILEMSLCEATLDHSPPSLPAGHNRTPRVTLYTSWRWGVPEDLTSSALRGSLCSRLLLDWLAGMSSDSNEGLRV